MMGKIKSFIKESKQEFDRVDWPSREDTVRYTIFVVGISLAIAAFLGGLDYIFVNVLEVILS